MACFITQIKELINFILLVEGLIRKTFKMIMCSFINFKHWEIKCLAFIKATFYSHLRGVAPLEKLIIVC